MMEKKYARLAALLAAAVLCGNGAPSMADELVGNGDNEWHIVINSDYNGDVYGNKEEINTTTGAVTGHVEMTGGTVGDDVYGGWADDTADVKDSTVTITSGSTVEDSVYGGYNQNGSGEVSGNTVTITGGTVKGSVYGGYSNGGGEVSDNTVTITSGSTVKGSVYGGFSNGGGEVSGNTVTITGCTVNDAYSTAAVYGGSSNEGAATGNRVTITGNTVTEGVYGGWGDTDATNNRVTITGGTVGTEDSSSIVYGGYSSSTSGQVSNNTVTITGGGTVTGDVYGGYSEGGSAANNTVALLGSADVEEASLHGRNAASEGSGNTLLIDGWTGSEVKDVQNFSDITFQNIQWQTDGTVLDITHNSQTDALKGTAIHLDSISFAGGTELQTGDSMTFIEGDNLGIQEGNVDVADTFTAGVAAVGTGEMSVGDDGNTLSYTLTEVSRNTQTDLIAENRAVAAAFVNQGADIAADSLRLLDDGYHYGMQTFGAVYGNRSQYDVNSDIKINGWSEIAGFGNIHEVKGGRLAWGVFYENGTGNYRTWNEFNNEMFRGDGSLLYNGGGAAIRLTKDSGMYYEASLRAGTLSSSMSNAVKDGNGNSYGFDSDSTYWGAHVGAGKLIQRGSGQWDIYGKYFHTDIDGDSFEMGGDRFSFDSVTSDRFRLGARYTADTDKAWSLYCGAAYEYEFSGDSHMKAGQFEAPEQSLQGSTVFGEIGTVWGRKDSPWSMDVNLRGYAGEREGFSGMVQLAYAF